MEDDQATSSTITTTTTCSLSDDAEGGGGGNLSPPQSAILPDSPSMSTFLRTAATLDGLAKQLETLNSDRFGSGSDDGKGTGPVRCCCGLVRGCRMWVEKESMEDKLKLSGEIGNALLQRYEALEKKLSREVERYEHQLEVKRTALAESIRRVYNLEKANATHMQKYAEMSRKNEALEKRYTQAMHTQTLTQQSLTHVRSELTALRTSSRRQSLALANGIGVEERLQDAERRYEQAKEGLEVEERRARDESRKRKRAEARIAELEGQVRVASLDVEKIKEGRARDAQDLLTNAKDRLATLHSELSETFRADSPSELPEYQRTLEDLVASNTLLKFDASELTAMLADSREETRALRDEIDELRSVMGVAKRSPEGVRRDLAGELCQSQDRANWHNRTESSPIIGTIFAEQQGWTRVNISNFRQPGVSAWEHHRRSSMAQSITSNSTAEGLTSPGLGMGPVGEFGGALVRDDTASGTLSPPPLDGRESPKPVFRTSPSGGIAYVLNGVPKSKIILAKPPARRHNAPRPSLRSFSSNGVDPIPESDQIEEPRPGEQTDTEPLSPNTSEYSRSAAASRNRRSIILHRHNDDSPRDSVDYSPNASNTLVDQSSITADFPSPRSEGHGTILSPAQKRVYRKTLLLLTKNQSVQTDRILDGQEERIISVSQGVRSNSMTSNGTSPNPLPEGSETSSIHEARSGILALVEYLAKILQRLHSADVPTLNKRLKKQHLPGDVGHLSRSTMRNLQLEVSGLRHHFRSVLDSGLVNKKEFNALLKVFKDVFNDLIELQSVVNDITIDPHLAKKLEKQAFREDAESDAKGKQAGGLGWIAAPITKFFVTPAAEVPANSGDSPRAGRGLERSRLQPATIKAAPKLQASTSATTTHISVEFGGTGIVRKALPAVAPAVETTLRDDDHPQPMGRAVSSSATGEGGLAPPAVRAASTLRPSKSKANRNELLGIFAGAPKLPSSTGGGSWQVVNNAPGPNKSIRAVSSQYFGDQTIRQARPIAEKRARLSSAVDAVIDVSADQLENDQPEMATTPFEPPLLERTLRQRGLSDSSIRSTFQSHGTNPGERLLSGSTVTVASGPAMRVSASTYGSSVIPDRGGMFSGIANRWYPFQRPITDNEVTLINPIPGPDPDPTPRAIMVERSTSPLPVPVAIAESKEADTRSRSPAKPIPLSHPHSVSTKSGGAVVPASQTATTQTIFGMLANSLVVGHQDVGDRNGDEDGEVDVREGELRGAQARFGDLRRGKGGWK